MSKRRRLPRPVSGSRRISRSAPAGEVQLFALAGRAQHRQPEQPHPPQLVHLRFDRVE